MDIEKANRTELISGLRSGFDCFEEVELAHAHFTGVKLRADLIALPRDGHLDGFVFAFEVKAPSSEWGYGTWCGHIKQAHDYLYARVIDKRFAELRSKIVSCAFLFPSPPFKLQECGRVDSPYIQMEDEVVASGAFRLGLHLKVGRAFWEKRPPHRRLVLAFGANDVWNGAEGFLASGNELVQGKRKVGSRKVSLLSLLKS